MSRARFPWLLFAGLMALDIAAFLLQKTASTQAKQHGHYFVTILTQVWAWAALALGPLQLLTWTRILSRADISVAYPLTSLHVPLTMLASAALLGERVPLPVWAGVVLITLGAAILKPPDEHEPDRSIPPPVS